MDLEKWQKITGNIKDNFTVLDEGEDHLDDEGGVDIEYIEFEGPLGKIRLEYVIKPVILDKKTNYTRRVGSETQVNYVYSEDEKSHQLMAYKWDDDTGEWGEIDGGMFGN